MHPNMMPKIIPGLMTIRSGIRFCLKTMNACRKQGFSNQSGQYEPNPVFRKFQAETGYVQDFLSRLYPKGKQNSKTATDSVPHGTHFYRSWRNLLATPQDYEACVTCGYDHAYDGPYVGGQDQSRSHRLTTESQKP
jgi:hypothetical protein